MNTITVEKQPIDINLHREGAGDHEPNVPDAPLIALDAATRDPVLVLARYPADKLPALRAAMRAYWKAHPGVVSRIGGSRTDTTPFGFAAAQPLLRRVSCRPCGGAAVAPTPHAMICDAATALDATFTALYPERAHADHARAIDAILPDWFLGESHWTSGVLNYNSPIGYHRDANNLPCWSAMVCVRRGMRGGHLHLPEYAITLPCRDGDVLYFPGYDILHAVTPLRRNAPDAYRLTAVYYTVARMAGCGPADDQLALAQARRTASEDTLIERQRASGWLNA